MMRILASGVIGLLFVLNLALPSTDIGRRGNEAQARMEAEGSLGAIGTRLPEFSLRDLSGNPVSSESLRGHRVLLTFERSVDW